MRLSNVVTLIAVLVIDGAVAHEKPPDLTPAGRAILQDIIEAEGSPLYDRPGPGKPETFPLPMCTFPLGLCGAVRRDGTVAVQPRYDWVGTFSDGRAVVRVGGLYGFVDEEGREVVKPQYRVVEDYQFGFAQVEVDGKSGLIDRDGKMVIEPKYGSIRAIAPDRFRVSETRHLGGRKGGEDFSGMQFILSGGVTLPDGRTGVIDTSGKWIEPLDTSSPPFGKDNASLRWVQKDKLWGLARADGSWLIEPKFEQTGSLNDGLARVALNGKFGFIDQNGNFVIEPVFDKARPFVQGVGRTEAQQGSTVGVIDKSGAWVFQTNYQWILLARDFSGRLPSDPPFGWQFTKDGRSGLLDLDGRVVLDADFDQVIQRCHGDGRLIALKNGEWLYFKADGRPLQPPAGRLIDAGCGGIPPYILKVGNKFGLVDGNSSPLTSVQFDAITRAAPSIRNVKIDEKWGRIASDGRWLIEPKFDYLSAGADVFVASIDGKRGFMQSDGTWLIEPRFDAR